MADRDHRADVPAPAAGKICAVIVTYHPEPARLNTLVSCLNDQVQMVYVVDNSDDRQEAPTLADMAAGVETLQFGENRGVAAAHNAGIAFARSRGCSHVLLMDQDSLPRPDMVAHLVRAEQTLLRQGEKIAAVGPLCFHPERGYYEPFLLSSGMRVVTRHCHPETPSPFAVDHLISSGSLVSLAVLEQVGPMDEGFFIDYVDIEWAFRARKHGYVSFAVCDAVLEHHLGAVARKKAGCVRRDFSLYGPTRLYYQFRNYVALLKKNYVSRPWLVHHMVRYLLPRFVSHGAFLPPRGKNMAMMGRGIVAGCRGDMGTCPVQWQ